MAAARGTATLAAVPSPDALESVAAAVEDGAGLPDLARALSRALSASAAIIDRAGSVLAVAAASPDDERALMTGATGTSVLELRAGGELVGELRLRPRGGAALETGLARTLAALVALELERSGRPERASEAAVTQFLGDIFQRRLTDRDNLVARGKELGTDLEEGGAVVIARVHALQPEDGDWRARMLALAERAGRRLVRGTLAAWTTVPAGGRTGDHAEELTLLVPGPDADAAARVLEGVQRELRAVTGFAVAVASSRAVGDPVDIQRAAAEAVLTANVAEARGAEALTFEETGAYRLLLTAISEDPTELQRFFEETVAPLIAYDDQYETELVRTLETFLDEDANVARTAERLFTHRHTIRYRLDRVRELVGLDVSSTDGRERLGLGLKAMRVLGKAPPRGPALEPGAEAGRVPREEKDR